MTSVAAARASDPRRILHIDMDAFFASVEQRDRPELRGRPVVVGGPPESRGVVAAASYEARRFGIRSAMPSARAARLCPDLVFVPPAFDKYVEVSSQLRSLLQRFTPLIEPISLDECFLDVTDHLAAFGTATALAKAMKEDVRTQLGLTASAGVAPSKFVAKVASDAQKPDGLVVVPPEKVLEFLAPRSVAVIWGIGPKTAKRLESLGIESIADLRLIPTAEMVGRFGKAGYRLSELAWGIDHSPVEPHRETKNVSRERTFSHDIVSLAEIRAALMALLEEMDGRSETRRFRGVHLKVRYADFVTVTRSMTLAEPTLDATVLRDRALDLLGRTEVGRRPIRLLGVGISDFAPDSPQLDLPFS